MDDALENWIDLKNQISRLEKKLNGYKDFVKKYMIENDLNTIKNSDGKIEVNRTRSSSTRISKQDVPDDLWTEYAKVNVYDVYNIKNVKLQRSRKI